jgi:hypothetical protein
MKIQMPPPLIIIIVRNSMSSSTTMSNSMQNMLMTIVIMRMPMTIPSAHQQMVPSPAKAKCRLMLAEAI